MRGGRAQLRGSQSPGHGMSGQTDETRGQATLSGQGQEHTGDRSRAWTGLAGGLEAAGAREAAGA